MSYKYSKGSTVQGDIKAADDTQRDTLIDFGEDQIDFQTSGSTRMQINNTGVDVQGDLSVAGDIVGPEGDHLYIKSEKNIYAVLDTDSDNGSYFVVRGNGASSVFVIGEDGKVNQGSSDTPRNSYVLRHDATDGNNGMMIMNNSTSISTDNLLGGIGFDSNDGNEPSSILEASAYIAAYAAEAHSAFDKGGYLVLGVSQINDNDDTISTEILRMEQGSITTTVPIHISGSVTEGLRIGKTASGYSEIQFETDGVDTAYIHVSSTEALSLGSQKNGQHITFHTTDGSGTAERVRIESTGDVGIGVSNALYRLDVHDNTTSFVVNFQQESSVAGADMMRMDFSDESNPSGQIIYVLDQDNDRIYQVIGNGAGGSTVSTSFTAGHDTVIPQGTNVIPGMIVESTGIVWYKPTDITSETALPKCRLASSDGSKTVFGVVGGFPAPDAPKEEDMPYVRNGYVIAPAFPAYGRAAGVASDEWQINTMSIGEGVIWVSDINGNIENGDFIESSSIAGYGRKQDDDIMRSKTVAKCTETVDWSSITDTVSYGNQEYKVKLMSCTFHCG